MGEILDFKQQEIDYISAYISPNKITVMEKVLQSRTNFLTVVLENLYQPHNASAVLRTCDCFGIQKAHIINGKNEFLVQEQVSHGAEKWVEATTYSDTETCLNKLKDEGYLIAVTDLENYQYDILDMPLNQKTAIVFGTEWEGTSDKALEMADFRIKIPIFGFTQSFNISVSAAIILHHLSSKMRLEQKHWSLNESEKIHTLHYWYCQLSNVRLTNKILTK